MKPSFHDSRGPSRALLIWVLTPLVATAPGCGTGAPKTYQVESFEHVEALVHPARDLAYEPLTGPVRVLDFAPNNAIVREVGPQGASVNVIAFPIGPAARERFDGYFKWATTKGAMSVGPASTDVIVTKAPNGSFLLAKVTIAGEYLKSRGALQGLTAHLSHTDFTLVCDDERFTPLVLVSGPRESSPIGNGRVAIDQVDLAAELKPVHYAADLQLDRAPEFDDAVRVTLLFPRPKGTKPRVLLFEGK